MADALQLREIAQKLRQLQQSSPIAPDGLDDWYTSARRFTEWQYATFPSIRLPSQVVFYLHDADIRVKDPEYRKNQDEVLNTIIASLERGTVPESSGVTASFHPRWLGAVGLVILAVFLYWVAR